MLSLGIDCSNQVRSLVWVLYAFVELFLYLPLLSGAFLAYAQVWATDPMPAAFWWRDIGIRRRERKKLLRLASFLLFRVALQLFLELLVLYHLIGALPDHLIGALPDFFISDFGLLKSHRSQAGIFTFINSFRC